MSEKPQKDDVGMLIKLMGMTTSSNENEALAALRKANAYLSRIGENWESLLRGKIKIIEDPFKNFTPPEVHRTAPPPPPPPPQPARGQGQPQGFGGFGGPRPKAHGAWTSNPSSPPKPRKPAKKRYVDINDLA